MAQYTDARLDNLTSAAQSNLTATLEQVDDPNDRLGSSFVYQSDPRSKAADFGDYPIIIIEDYGVEQVDTNPGGNIFTLNFSAELVVVAADDSAQQKQAHDRISDQVQFLFSDAARQQLGENGISQPSIDRSQRFTGVDRADQPVIRREIEVSGDMQVDSEQVNGGDPYAG